MHPIDHPIQTDYNHKFRMFFGYYLPKFTGIRFVVRHVKNLARALSWFKHGWTEYDWDHAFLLTTLEKKIKDMRTYHIKYGVTDRDYVKYMIWEMDVALEYLYRLLENEYHEVAEKEFEKKYGGLPFTVYDNTFGPFRGDEDWTKEDDIKGGREWKHEESFALIPAANRKEARLAWKDVYKRSEELQQNDLRDLMWHLQLHLRGWWD